MSEEATQQNFQLELSEPEISRLSRRIQQDYRAAIGDHTKRIRRWADYYRRWRAMPDVPAIGDEEKSNFSVPLIRWNTLSKWAKEMDATFGDEAQVIAVPTGPSDERKVHKISRYMTWLVFSYMKIILPMVQFVFFKILYGRAIAYTPWKRETFMVKGEEVVDFEGPDFIPLWPDDFIVPAEDARSVHDFSFVIRRYHVRPDQLLKGEAEGRYQGIRDNFEQIVNLAQRGLQREYEGEEIKREADDAEGISYQRPMSAGENLMVLEWYGRWRMLKKGETDAGEWDFAKREMEETEVVVRYQWDLNKIISVQDLAELYPGFKNRRPFSESAMLPEGRYWSMGLCELLVDAEDELKVNHNAATDGIGLSVNPPIAVRPASGMDTDQDRWEVGQRVITGNPATDFKQLEIHTDIPAVQWKEQTILGYVERVTAITDQSMGRASDRPNAPRTARQSLALLQESNIGQSLYTLILSEDMSLILQRFWQLEYWFAPERQFFRVSEEDADGLFETKEGGSYLEKEERDGRFDFKLKFADSYWSREAEKERVLQRFELDLKNPLIVSNPAALWEITNEMHTALGNSNFSAMVPKPPTPDLPVEPKEEWNRLLEGEEIHVNPLDNDELHLMDHTKRIQEATKDGSNPDALKKMLVHYVQQIQQLQQKKVMQAIAEQAMQAVQQLGASQGALQQIGAGGQQPGQPQQPQPGGPLQAAPPQPGMPGQ